MADDNGRLVRPRNLAEVLALSEEDLAAFVHQLPEGNPLTDADVTETPRPTPTQNLQERLRDELFRTGSTFKPTKREEIVGINNVMGEIDELIHWLRHSRQYGEHRSRLQPGVIFAGSPGTGKTLVSRWIATASNARFINVRDFVHKSALFTDHDIHELFERARDTYIATKCPVVLFWDEFENAAIERSSDQSTPEQQAVVSQLTAELDGIHGKNEGILLIGCTNYLSSIDGALMRRGRMGLQIEFHAPDRAGKERILGFYLDQMITVPGIDLHTLSYFFPKSSTAADIEEACVEAWRRAVKRSIDHGGTPCLAQEDLVGVFIKQLVGPPTTFTLPDAERMSIAIHECGHAICALAYGVPLRLITVQPGKKSLGRVMVDDLQEYVSTIPETLGDMKVGLGGMAAEAVAGIPTMMGAADDLRRVCGSAERLVTDLGRGENVGLFNMTALERTIGYSTMAPQVSQGLLDQSDADVRAIVAQVEHDAFAALASVGHDNILQLAGVVKKQVTMTGNEFSKLFVSVCGYEAKSIAAKSA